MQNHIPCFGKIVVDCKDIYTDYLLNILTPLIYEGLKSVYDKAITYEKHYDIETKKNSKIQNPGINALFQHFLLGFKKMNQHMITEETQRIRDNSHHADIFDNLIKAVIKSHIETLTYNKKNSKLSKEKYHDNIDIYSFIHKCYIESAKLVYEQPELFNPNHNQIQIFQLIKQGIKNAIKQTLPMKQILDEYLDTNPEQVMEEYNVQIKDMLTKDLQGGHNTGINMLQNSSSNDKLDLDNYDLNEFINGRKIDETINEYNTNIIKSENKKDIIGGNIEESSHKDKSGKKVMSDINQALIKSENNIDNFLQNYGGKSSRNDVVMDIIKPVQSVTYNNNNDIKQVQSATNNNDIKPVQSATNNNINIVRKTNINDNHFSEITAVK